MALDLQISLDLMEEPIKSGTPAAATLMSVDHVGFEATYQVCRVTDSPERSPQFDSGITGGVWLGRGSLLLKKSAGIMMYSTFTSKEEHCLCD